MDIRIYNAERLIILFSVNDAKSKIYEFSNLHLLYYFFTQGLEAQATLRIGPIY